MLLKSYPHYDVKAIVNTDYHREMCILGFAGEKDSGRVIALAHYRLDDDAITAELDFAVHPDFGRSGVATSMVRYIAQRSADRGIKTFVSYISRGNEQAFGVFQKLGYALERSLSAGAYEIRLRLDEPATAQAP